MPKILPHERQLNRAWEDPTVSTARFLLLALCTAGLCTAGVFAGVVVTGRDGPFTDALAIVAVAALVIARRLHTRLHHASITG